MTTIQLFLVSLLAIMAVLAIIVGLRYLPKRKVEKTTVEVKPRVDIRPDPKDDSDSKDDKADKKSDKSKDSDDSKKVIVTDPSVKTTITKTITADASAKWKGCASIITALVVGILVLYFGSELVDGIKWMASRPKTSSSDSRPVLGAQQPGMSRNAEKIIIAKVVRGISESYDIPKTEIEELLILSKGMLDDTFRTLLWDKYGIRLPEDITMTPMNVSYVPNGTKTHVRFMANQQTWSREFSTKYWDSDYDTPIGYDQRLVYLFDAGTVAQKHVRFDPSGKKRIINADGTLGEVLPDLFGGEFKVQVRLPKDYIFPPGVSEVEVTVTREKVPN